MACSPDSHFAGQRGESGDATNAFDPATDRLVQLFPDQLWFDTTIAVGAVMLVLALATAAWAGRLAGRLSRPAPEDARR